MEGQKTAAILSELATGTPGAVIARAHNTSEAAVSRLKSKHKDIIVRTYERFIARSAPLAAMAAYNLIKHYAVHDTRQTMHAIDRKHAFAFTMETLKGTGMLGSHTPSALTVNILNQDNRVQVDSEELGIVQHMLALKRDDDIQDAEIVEETGQNEGDSEGTDP